MCKDTGAEEGGAHRRVLGEDVDGGAAVDGGGEDSDDDGHGRGGVGVALVSCVGVGEGDVLVARGAEEAPLGEAPAAHGVWAEEGVWELHAAAEAAIEGGALRDDGGAGYLLDGTGEDGNGGGEEVVSVAVLAEAIVWESAKQAVDEVVLRESRGREGANCVRGKLDKDEMGARDESICRAHAPLGLCRVSLRPPPAAAGGQPWRALVRSASAPRLLHLSARQSGRSSHSAPIRRERPSGERERGRGSSCRGAYPLARGGLRALRCAILFVAWS